MTQVETETRQLSFIQAVNEALRQEMERDDRVFVMGEDIAGGAGRPEKEDAWGGPMKLTKGLIGQFGPERVRDTPISEAGFIGAGVGAAAAGLRGPGPDFGARPPVGPAGRWSSSGSSAPWAA